MLFYSIDALFGLCRKKAAGCSVRPPLHSQVFFELQDEVQSYIGSYRYEILESLLAVNIILCLEFCRCDTLPSSQVVNSMLILNTVLPTLFFFQECNEFLAGNALRAKSRYRALDETAVIGSCCRHEFPRRFFSSNHGER